MSTLATGAPGAGGAAAGRALAGAAAAGAWRGSGWRLATAAGGGAGGSPGGSGVETTNAGGGAGETQLLAPVAAVVPRRGWAYWSLIVAIDAPVGRSAPAGCATTAGWSAM